MWLYVSSRFNFDLAVKTPFLLMLRPRGDINQWVSREEYVLEPDIPVLEYKDSFGNLCQRLTAPKGEFSIRSSAIVMVPEQIDVNFDAGFVRIQNLPDYAIPFLLPSRYCESDRLGQLAGKIVEGAKDGYEQVYKIYDWVQNTIEFAPGSSFYPMSAVEVQHQGYGVCRDLAHLCIALCRGISIPARMVVGYLDKLEPMDLHAWFEAYVGGKWYAFDPTQEYPRGSRVTVAYGRDAADVAVYNYFGPSMKYCSINIKVDVLDGLPE